MLHHRTNSHLKKVVYLLLLSSPLTVMLRQVYQIIESTSKKNTTNGARWRERRMAYHLPNLKVYSLAHTNSLPRRVRLHASVRNEKHGDMQTGMDFAKSEHG
mmetsp:Transcript_30453/g.78895  ORF Transcript_30453/g.78895 Transcript_30453/m.78895 type:complete len:102 (+) Transcript_30453:1333-1638(+)